MTENEFDKLAHIVCCPMCDNKKCVRGTELCEAEQWKKAKKVEMVE